ncbi:MAG: hypothetical protein OXE99_04025, partial [Cellvibrionales bacterium]|nr:hypothetical protein [Cellvibrionales bacterium]
IPNTPTYGASFLGYHFYTWAFIAYTALIIVTGIALLMPNQLVPQSQPILFKQQPLWIKLVLSLTLVVILGNAVSAFLECGLGACDDNPVEYELLSKINLFLYTNGWNHHFF